MARSRLNRLATGVTDDRQLPLPGLFSSDPNHVQFLIGEVDLELIDPRPGFGRVRGVNKRHMNGIRDHWSDPACDPLRLVYLSETGRYAPADGEHRLEAARLVGYKRLPARVERSCSIPEAAELFLARNRTRRVSTADIFYNEVVANHEDALELRELLEEFGLYVFVDSTRSAKPEIHVPAIAAVKRVYARHGRADCQEILRCISEAWGLKTAGALSRELLLGLSEFWARYGDRFDRAGLVAHLQRTDPPTLIRQADQLRGASRPRFGVSEAIRRVVRDLYNSSRRGGRLDE